MTNKYVSLDNDGEFQYTQSINSSAGSGDANKIVSTGSDGKLADSLLPAGIGQNSQMFIAKEALEANKMVNIYRGVHQGGNENLCRKSDNTNGRAAHGYVKKAYAENASAEIFFDGNIPFGGSAFNVGDDGFLGTDGGVITTSLNPNTTTGKMFQNVGTFIDIGTLHFAPSDPIGL